MHEIEKRGRKLDHRNVANLSVQILHNKQVIQRVLPIVHCIVMSRTDDSCDFEVLIPKC